MIGSHRLYRFYASLFEKELYGAQFSHAISFVRDALLIHFVRGEEKFTYEIKFVNGELLILTSNWTDESSKKKSNALLQFKDLESQYIEGINFGLFDRLFTINFSGGYRLLFKGYGKFGNILLFHEAISTPVQIFRLNLKKDWLLQLDNVATIWRNTNETWELLPKYSNDKDWVDCFKSIPFKSIELACPDFLEMNIHDQNQWILEFQNPLKFEPSFSIDNEIPQLKWRLTSELNWDGLVLAVYHELKEYLKWYYFKIELEELTTKLKRNLKILRSKNEVLSNRLNELLIKRDYKELGDLILSNAHTIGKGVSEALIHDYYTGHRLRIKLNPELSAAENAEKFYKKSKNKNLEIDNIREQLSELEKGLSTWQNLEMEISNIQTIKDLRRVLSTLDLDIGLKTTKKSELQTSTYRKLFMDGFEIWVGKNAKSNEALLKDAHKNDLWLHAADLPGSHVLIRSNGKVISKTTLEKVASLAAHYSKGKGQTLQTVLYTERKNISKAKHAAIGAVKLSKFQSVDVEPGIFL